jgi:hypothetical protein
MKNCHKEKRKETRGEATSGIKRQAIIEPSTDGEAASRPSRLLNLLGIEAATTKAGILRGKKKAVRASYKMSRHV